MGDSDDETWAERAARWRAESAEVKPPSVGTRFMRSAAIGVPALVIGLMFTALIGCVVYVMWRVAHQDEAGDDMPIGRVAPGACLPDDAILSGDLTQVDTIACEEPHLAEVFLSFRLESVGGVPATECDVGWQQASDVPLSVSQIYIGLVQVGPMDSPVPDTGLCVAVGQQPVEGREALYDWQP